MQNIPTPRNLSEFYQYELQLARALYHIERRGVLMDVDKLKELRSHILAELGKTTQTISDLVGIKVAYSKDQAERLGWNRKEYINLASPADVLRVLKTRKLKLPINRFTHHETTGEDALNQIYADTGDEFVREVLKAREFIKIFGYTNVRLHNGVLYSTYRVTGTVTGRRSANKNLFGYGTNHQNLPKHSELGKKFRDCIIAREGKVLINCDQSQAEDWIVSGIIGDMSHDFFGLNELSSGKDRHTALASKLFAMPESMCGKDTLERFMGKKVRHAGNYDMEHQEFARQLVKEGIASLRGKALPELCKHFLMTFHKEEPGIKGVFHKHVQDCLSTTRMLRTPLSRERVFFGCRPYDDNKKVFKEAYAYIPQSTVGDNTGLCILHCELNDPGLVVMDTHDAVTLEVDDNPTSISRGVELLDRGFARQIQFQNGLEIQIPVEFEIGYSLGKMVSEKQCQKNLSLSGAM